MIEPEPDASGPWYRYSKAAEHSASEVTMPGRIAQINVSRGGVLRTGMMKRGDPVRLLAAAEAR